MQGFTKAEDQTNGSFLWVSFRHQSEEVHFFENSAYVLTPIAQGAVLPLRWLRGTSSGRRQTSPFGREDMSPGAEKT